MGEEVLYNKERNIGIITLNKPEQRNTLDLYTLNQLIDAFKKSGENKDVCVIYQAEGKHFTVGADLKYAYKIMTDPSRLEEGVLFQNTFQTLTRAMMSHPGIIIVGLHGWVIGGGFEQTLYCDIRIAAEDTRIMLPELGVGIFFSNASTKLLPRIIGEGRAKHLMLLGQEINAEEALKIGLVTQVCKPTALKRILKKMANNIVQKSHLALQYTKKLVNENQDLPMEAVLDSEAIAMLETGSSEEARKRITKFATERH
ncbi:MAG: enoyl-CoA hydratase/isomerase family protein [Promethearchaeota archaeon]